MDIRINDPVHGERSRVMVIKVVDLAVRVAINHLILEVLEFPQDLRIKVHQAHCYRVVRVSVSLRYGVNQLGFIGAPQKF